MKLKNEDLKEIARYKRYGLIVHCKPKTFTIYEKNNAINIINEF